MPTIFENTYSTLNPEQKLAVDTIEGPVLVIAGPGTGKTTILTLRIGNIINKTDTAPDSILALTFTEAGAYAMKRKLVEVIGKSAYKVNIFTFHGFAEEIIRTNPDVFPRIIGSSVINDAEKMKIVNNILESKEIKMLRPFGDPIFYVRPILREISILKRENISPKDFKKSLEKDGLKNYAGEKLSAAEEAKIETRNAKNKELAFVYEKYEKKLQELKRYDFEDMLLELIHAMENNDEFKLSLQEKYQYILADEHQDANASQNRILELLADFHDSPNLFIVGDDKQAIYRFQGASLENFLYFGKKYSDAKIISLKHNYRSHQSILDASHSLIINNPGVKDRAERLMSLKIGGGPIKVFEFKERDVELAFVADSIAALISSGEKPEEIAILYRENGHSRAISNALSKRNISHRIESDKELFEDIDASKVLILLRAINNPSSSEDLVSALLLPEFDCDPGALSELGALSRRKDVPVFELIQNNIEKGKVKDGYKKITNWSKDAVSTFLPEFLEKVINESGIINTILNSENSADRLDSIKQFFSIAESASMSDKNYRLKNFLEYVDLMTDHGIKVKRSSADRGGEVRLMTAHRSKGLEFDFVFIVHAVDGTWGNKKNRSLFSVPVTEHMRDVGRIEDERRLFYVAMTRAREAITITFALSDGEKERMESQFISEADQNLISFESVDSMAVPPPKLSPEKVEKARSIVDKDFVGKKFLSQPLSVTHINNYLECAWKYFFVNLIRLPQAKTKHQMYGSAIHNALRSFFDAYKEEKSMDAKEVINIFKNNLEKEPLSKKDFKDSVEKGEKALKAYLTNYKGTWNRNVLNEYDVRGVSIDYKDINTGEDTFIQLNGKLDKVEFLDGNNVVVVDYKTGKPKSKNEIAGKTKSSDGNYFRQLTFYKLILDLAGKYNMKYGEIDFIEPNEKGKNKKESFEIDNSNIKSLVLAIKTMADDIISGSFANRNCEDENCQYCRLSKIVS